MKTVAELTELFRAQGLWVTPHYREVIALSDEQRAELTRDLHDAS